eukprot:6013954-Pyramimonas_sp.AAC.1
MIKRTSLPCIRAGLTLAYKLARRLALCQSALHNIRGFPETRCHFCRSGSAIGISTIVMAIVSTSAQSRPSSTLVQGTLMHADVPVFVTAQHHPFNLSHEPFVGPYAFSQFVFGKVVKLANEI